jgi:hypothetical protein
MRPVADENIRKRTVIKALLGLWRLSSLAQLLVA